MSIDADLPHECRGLLPHYTGSEPKVEILNPDAYADDKTMLTIVFHNEDHTMGNALKELICKMKGVEFCGYNIPHPLEDKILFRIQTREGFAAGDILLQAFDDLDRLFLGLENKFNKAYAEFNSS